MKLPLPALHRIEGGVADWERIPSEEWNQWQIRAAETNGLDTPGNRETAKGLISGLASLALIARGHTTAGTLGLLWARNKDLKDGKIAEATGTKGPVGEVADVVTDNILAVMAVPALRYRKIISTEQAVAIGGIVGLKFFGSGITRARGREEHASRIAKVGAALEWGGLIGLTAKRIAEEWHMPKAAEKIGAISDPVLNVGITLGLAGSAGYLRTAFRRSQRR